MKNNKIVKLQVENIMRVKTAEILPKDSTVVIGGKNMAGKTTILESIAMALGGKRAIPVEPIHRGEDSANIILELEDIIITLNFTANDKSYLKVTAKDGAAYSSPQAMLDKLYSSLTFDPLAFSRMGAMEQAVVLMRLAGLDFTELDSLREQAYDERRDLSRDVKAMEARIKSAERYEDVPDEQVIVSGIMQELEAAETENESIREQKHAMELCERLVAEKKAEIESLEQKLETAREILSGAEEELKSFSGIKEPIDLSPFKERLATAAETNEKIKANEAYKSLAREYQSLTSKVKDCTKTMESIDSKKATMLAGANFPIGGLSINENGVTYSDIVFSQCSQAERLRVSVAMGLAMNPELRVLLIRDGSLLDKDNLEMISEMAKDADAQIWIERVGEGEECSIIMVDGEVTTKKG